MTTLALSHVVVLVSDLGTAVADYAALGFRTTWEGEPGTARSALVWFDAGPHLELALPAAIDRGRDGPEGPRDYAVQAADLDAEVARVRHLGIGIADPVHRAGVRRDGRIVHWRLAVPYEGDLPLLVSPITAPERDRAAEHGHANGVREIAGIVVGAREPSAADARLATLLGAPPDDLGITVVGAAVDAVCGVRFMHPTGTQLVERRLHGVVARVEVPSLHG